MHSVGLILALLLVPRHIASRVQKADRSSLQRVKALLNDEASRVYSAVQSDAIDVFADIQRNPNATRNKDELSVNDPENYFQGDVDLSVSQVKKLEEELTRGNRKKRKVGRTPLYKLWDRTAAISFDFADTIPRATRAKIRDAMRLWQRHTCVRFEEGGPSVDRLEFFDGGGCSSFVGMVGGTQGVSISTPGCDVVGIISHEIGHALGIFHEQARPDQDRYIAINYNNIPLGRWNNFQPVPRGQAETYDLPYDTGSVMHYGPYGFAADPYVPTIRTLERNQQTTIGQRAGPSFLDYQAINAAYGCTDHCPPISCQRNGYPNPNNCTQCLCPDGVGGQFCTELRPSNAQCGGYFTAVRDPQHISSPSYPERFSINTECYWLIQAPPGGRVFMKFEGIFDFRCEDTCDKSYVEVKYHNDKRLTGARFCCSTIPSNTYISFDNEMMIILRGYGGGSRGFWAKIWSDRGESPVTTTAAPETSESLVIETEMPVFVTEPITATTATEERFTTEYTSSSTTTTTTTTTTTLTTTSATTTVTTEMPTTAEVILPLTVPAVKPLVISTLLPTLSPLPTLLPVITITTQSPDIISSGAECGCTTWSEWTGPCSQECGGCGHRTRTRTCQKDLCRKEEKRPCNFNVCPMGTNFLINNGEFHILWRGCCVGLFRGGAECSALETNQNPFFKIISSLLTAQDGKNNRTDKIEKIVRGDH